MRSSPIDYRDLFRPNLSSSDWQKQTTFWRSPYLSSPFYHVTKSDYGSKELDEINLNNYMDMYSIYLLCLLRFISSELVFLSCHSCHWQLNPCIWGPVLVRLLATRITSMVFDKHNQFFTFDLISKLYFVRITSNVTFLKQYWSKTEAILKPNWSHIATI